VILSLCVLMFGHIIQLWSLYFKSKSQMNKQLSINEEEMKTLKTSTDH